MDTKDIQNIEYAKRIVVFIDILGFQELIDQSITNPTKIMEIYRLLDYTRQRTQWLSQEKDITDVDISDYLYHTFSDSVVLSCPYTSISNLIIMVDWVVTYQFEMWSRMGTFIRGAMVYDDIYEEDRDIVFGPALVKAYYLEKDNAVWPRILIDTSVLDNFSHADREWALNDFLREDEQHMFYIDYLRDLLVVSISIDSSEAMTPYLNPMQLFGIHKNNIENAMSACSKEYVLSKYISLAIYHNLVIDEYRQVISKLSTNYDQVFDLVSRSFVVAIGKLKNLDFTPKPPKISPEDLNFEVISKLAFRRALVDNNMKERVISSEFDDALNIVSISVLDHLKQLDIEFRKATIKT